MKAFCIVSTSLCTWQISACNGQLWKIKLNKNILAKNNEIREIVDSNELKYIGSFCCNNQQSHFVMAQPAFAHDKCVPVEGSYDKVNWTKIF